jgi:hypothetical protein
MARAQSNCLNYHYGMLLIHVWSHHDYLATYIYHESIWFSLDYMLSHDMPLTYLTLCTLSKTYLPNLTTYLPTYLSLLYPTYIPTLTTYLFTTYYP